MRDETDRPFAHLPTINARLHPGDELRATGKPRLLGRAVTGVPVPAEYAARRFRLHPFLLLSGVDTLNQGYPVPHPMNPGVAVLLLVSHAAAMTELPRDGVFGLFAPETERAHTPATPVTHAPAPQEAAPAPATDVGPAGGAGPAPAAAGAPTTAEGGLRRRRPAADAA